MRRAPAHCLAVLTLGFVSQVGQVLLLRELLMVFHGNELSIGIILAAWMGWVGIGSALGAILVEAGKKTPAAAGLPTVLPSYPPTFLPSFLVSAGLGPALLVTIFLIRRLRGFFALGPGAYLSLGDITVSSFVLMAPVCLLLGLQFVLLSRLWRQTDGVADTSGAGKTYIGEAAGNVLGGVLFTFVMVRHLNSFQSALVAGLLMPGAVLWLTRVKQDKKAGGGRAVLGSYLPPLLTSCLPTFIVVLLAAGGIWAVLGHLDVWAYRIQWRHFAPQHRLVETHRSKYGNIAIVQRDDQYSFFQSGHLIFSTAGPETNVPCLEEQDAAVLAHFALVQHEQPRRVLLLGGGLRGTLGAIVRHPVEQIDYIELDEVLTRVARPYVAESTRAALTDPRVRLLHGDGRLFVKQAGQKYDLVIVDVPDPATAVLNRYYTQEFFRQVRRRLHPDGVLVIGAVSTPGLRGTAVVNRNATLYHTLRSVFPSVLPVGGRFLFYAAGDASGQISADAQVLGQRYLQRDIQTEGFSHHHFALLLEPSQLRRVNWILRHHGRNPDAHRAGPQAGPLFPEPVAQQQRAEERLPPVRSRFFINSDFKPIGYYYTLMFWGHLTRAGHKEVFSSLLRIEPWWILPVVGLLLGTSVTLRMADGTRARRRGAYYAVLVAVATTGLSTMTLQIALLFSFQSTYGFVYEMVGLIVAIFMAGLALGTAFTHRYVADKANPNTLAMVQLSMAVLASLIAVVLPGVAQVESAALVLVLFSLLTFGAGWLNGVDFPLAAECCRALTRRAERAAGTVYAVELFGGCLGAAVASAVVAPVLGFGACCWLAAIANGTAFVVLLIVRRSHA
ncbi:MAG: spermine synthase [Planctomycetes bacterium]|nr:spermine synthase [Planctomycetota bacterium]